ncbi:hypothetical protein HispidOSU_025027, partial [Sigmodon hispidus]
MLWAPPQNVDKQCVCARSLNVFCNEDGGFVGKEAIFSIVTTFPCDNPTEPNLTIAGPPSPYKPQ